MGCLFSSFETEILEIKFSYNKLWTPVKNSKEEDKNTEQLVDTSITHIYENVYVDNPVIFIRSSVQDDYSLVLHFVDKNAIMFFRNGAAIIIFKDKNNKIASIVPWFQDNNFSWIFSRLKDIDDVKHEEVKIHLNSIKKINNIDKLKIDAENFQIMSGVQQTEYINISQKVVDEREYIKDKYFKNKNKQKDSN